MNYIYLLMFITAFNSGPTAPKTPPPINVEWYRSRLTCEAQRIRLAVAKSNLFISDCFDVSGMVIPTRLVKPPKDKEGD